MPTNYHIDSILPIVLAAAEVCGKKYEYESDNGRRLRRITDHVRACTFAVHENVYPGANKEKYVVKRLLRRAVLDGHQMGLREPFLHKLVPKVAEMMKRPYPELQETVKRVSGVIEKEEANFFGTIDAGLNHIDRVFDEMRRENRVTVDGAVAAELYQTYGVPPELFESLAAEHNLAFDWQGYEQAMEEHGEVSGKVQHAVMGARGPIDSLKQALHTTEFLGLRHDRGRGDDQGHHRGPAAARSLVRQDGRSRAQERGARGARSHAVLRRERRPGRRHGQARRRRVRVRRHRHAKGRRARRFTRGTCCNGVMREGAKVKAVVDAARRAGIRRAHSATHILHYALQKNLGSHAQQQGSKVDEDWLRFDFTNLSPVTASSWRRSMRMLRSGLRRRSRCGGRRCRWPRLARQGAMMLFGEKYPDPVRMVSMGAFSKELCGGTHLTNTGEVEQFEILSEEGVSAGTRRITALTGKKAAEHVQQIEAAVGEAAKLLGVSAMEVAEAAAALTGQARELRKQLSGGGGGGAKPQAEKKRREAGKARRMSR